MADKNNNGILDSHEKWWLAARVLVLCWSISFLSASYLGYAHEVDRGMLGSVMTAAAMSFIKQPK